jgi:hypothetical protein
MTKRIFISADHGMAIIYFLQSDLVPTLLEAGVEVVLLTDDEIQSQISGRFGRPGLVVEGLRLKQAEAYSKKVRPRWQWLLSYLRRVGGSKRINTEAMDSHIWEVWIENSWKFRLGIWIPAALWTLLLRSSSAARKSLVRMQTRFTPHRACTPICSRNTSPTWSSSDGWLEAGPLSLRERLEESHL